MHKNNHTAIWVGIIPGVLLTGLLMYGLQVFTFPDGSLSPPGAQDTPVQDGPVARHPPLPARPEPVKPQVAAARTETGTPDSVNTQVAEDTGSVPAAEPQQDAARPAAVSAVPETQGSDVSAAPPLPVPPAGLVLSEPALQALSDAERHRYAQMLRDWQALQQRNQLLEQQRTQLKQRLEQMIQENRTASGELEGLREQVQPLPDDAGKKAPPAGGAD
ncbi:MAG: hypothetical protein KDI44_08685 [Thiothrix sp.]|nr:hypothetical protein [Thiothrix sp.]HPQ97080.1 hypothetical protein [Thiolinea sp.]